MCAQLYFSMLHIYTIILIQFFLFRQKSHIITHAYMLTRCNLAKCKSFMWHHLLNINFFCLLLFKVLLSNLLAFVFIWCAAFCKWQQHIDKVYDLHADCYITLARTICSLHIKRCFCFVFLAFNHYLIFNTFHKSFHLYFQSICWLIYLIFYTR